jgi:hypothetical protein
LSAARLAATTCSAPTRRYAKENRERYHTTQAERRAILAQVRQALGEALVAHELRDQDSEHALLDPDLDREQQRLDQLWDDDPVGMAAFGDDDAWVNRRLTEE